MLEISVCVMM